MFHASTHTHTHTHKLPELVHSKVKGCEKVGHLVFILIGFSTSFTILLLIAIYEEELNSLVD